MTPDRFLSSKIPLFHSEERHNMEQKTAIENLLNCPICYDFLKVCMMTKCGHNFCSLCIRKYLSVRSQCPVCFENSSEPELCNNRIVDEIVKNYFILRKTLDQCLTTKLNESQNKTIIPIAETNSNDTELGAGAIAETQSDASAKVLCPVCNELIKIDVMNSHLDVCLTRGERKESLRKNVYPDKKKKMAKVVYHLLSESELRKNLDEVGLPTDGDKQNLIKRHKAFLVLYNAECDSLTPRPISELIRQVQREESADRRPIKQPKLFDLDKKSDPTLIEIEQIKYLKDNKTQFEKLIEDVQSRQPHSPMSKRTNSSRLSATEDMEAPSTSKQRKVLKTKPKPTQSSSEDELGLNSTGGEGRESPTF